MNISSQTTDNTADGLPLDILCGMVDNGWPSQLLINMAD